jgi:hypothetical protein
LEDHRDLEQPIEPLQILYEIKLVCEVMGQVCNNFYWNYDNEEDASHDEDEVDDIVN